MAMGLFIQDDGSLDIEFTPTGIKEDDSLQTPGLVTLFSDGRADIQDVGPEVTDLRGFWGDMYPDAPSYNPNDLALCFVMLLPFVYYLFLERNSIFKKIFLGFCFIIFLCNNCL